MMAYTRIKYHEDYRNEEVINKISLLVEKLGYETICIVRDIQANRRINMGRLRIAL